MTFPPRTREDIETDNLAPDGIYDFEVAKATDEISKSSGKEMIKVQLKVFGGEREYAVFDYLMAAMPRKLIDFCDAVGLASRYNKGEIDAQMVEGKAGKVELKTEAASGNYRAKNIVFQYVAAKDAANAEPAPAPKTTAAKGKFQPADEKADDIPF